MNLFDWMAFYVISILVMLGFCGGFFGGLLSVWCYNKFNEWKIARNLKWRKK